MNNFKICLEFGKLYEKLLAVILPNDCFMIMDGNFKYFDVIINHKGKQTKYEVKADKLTAKTNNITIEFNYNDKPSGISETMADYYAYFVIHSEEKYDLYLIPVEEIKKIIKDNPFNRVVNGGDNNKSKMYLFKLDLFKKYLFK